MSKERAEFSDVRKIPNVISLFRLAVVFFIFSSFIFDIRLLYLQIAYVLGALSDKADGIIARRYQWETKLGLYLEGIADGMLIFTTIAFVSFRLDFPRFLLTVALVIFLCGFLLSLIVRLLTKKWFTTTAPVNKAAVLLAHLVVVFYLFSLPARLEVTLTLFCLGVVLFLYYLVRMVKLAFRQR